MAFPSAQLRSEDPTFLRPYNPAEFEKPHFLFRIDNTLKYHPASVTILVQSALKPDWDYAFQNAPLLAAPPECREYNPTFSAGEEYRFRININLSQKKQRSAKGVDLRKIKEGVDKQGRPKSQSKRVILTWEKDQNPDEVIKRWFAAKGRNNGFELRSLQEVRLGWVGGYKQRDTQDEDPKLRFRAALLDGVLSVSDPVTFAKAIEKGIGSAKSFGFGLLSIAPVR
jgi:CRISPR system Cascade subunit CasE